MDESRKIDAGLMNATDLSKVPENVRKLEAQGYDGLITAEMSGDPFSPCCWRPSTASGSS